MTNSIDHTSRANSDMAFDEPGAVVVVADADAPRRVRAAASLRGAGYRVVEVDGPGRAAEACRITKAEIVVLDADGDDGEGLSALRALRFDRQLRRLPVVTVSADPSVDRVVASLERGARDHVRGPFSEAELVARVDAVLRIADENERLRRRNEELEYLGSTDEVTGLANRRQIEDEVDRLAAAAARHRQPLAAVLFAVDGWKEIEALGLETADAVLQEVAVLISTIRRTCDLAGRYADNQFLVLLPMTDRAGADIFARRVRAVVTAAPIPTDSGRLDVTLSAGYADGAPDAQELMLRAHKALEEARLAGGDTQVSAPD